MTVAENVVVNMIIKSNDKTVGKLQRNIAGLNAAFGSSITQFKAMHTETGKLKPQLANLNNAGLRLGAWVRRSTAGFRGFKMEMLGVMFFGMGMSRMFSQMLKPAAQLTGMFEIWSATLQVLFLPTLLELLPTIINFSQALMNLSPETQKAIGAFALLGLGMGKLLTIIGSVSLGVGSLIIAFGEPAVAALSAVAGWVAVLAAGLVMAFVGTKQMITNWGNNWKKVMSGGKLATPFLGILVIVPTIIAAIMEYWDNFANFFKNLWNGIEMTFWKAIRGMLTGIQNLFKSMSSLPLIGHLFAGGASKLSNAISNITTRIENLSPTTGGQSIQQTSSGIPTMADNFLGRGATINQTFNIASGDESTIRRIVSQENESLIAKLTRNMG